MSDETHVTPHVTPIGAYLAVFATLGVLTAVTVAAAFIDLGALNTIVALVIAAVKATLVMLIFMHLRWSGRLVALYAVVGFVFLAILIGLTYSDIVTRGWLPPVYLPPAG